MRVISIKVGINCALLGGMLEFDDFLREVGLGVDEVDGLGSNDAEEGGMVGACGEEVLPVDLAVADTAFPIYEEAAVFGFLNDDTDGIRAGEECLGIGEAVTGLVHGHDPADALPLAGGDGMLLIIDIHETLDTCPVP